MSSLPVAAFKHFPSQESAPFDVYKCGTISDLYAPGKTVFFLVENTVKSDLCTPCGPCLSAVDESDMACQISALFKVLEFYRNVPGSSFVVAKNDFSFFISLKNE